MPDGSSFNGIVGRAVGVVDGAIGPALLVEKAAEPFGLHNEFGIGGGEFVNGQRQYRREADAIAKR